MPTFSTANLRETTPVSLFLFTSFVINQVLIIFLPLDDTFLRF